MNLFSIFQKQAPEITSVAQALAGDAPVQKSKSRKSEQRQAQEQQLVPEKKRARRRLIGAVAMVLAVVIGLPMVLDSEPKPVSKNIVIQIPAKESALASLDPKEEVVQDDLPAVAVKPAEVSANAVSKLKPEEAVATVTESKASKAETKAETKSETRHVAEVLAKKETPAKTEGKPSIHHADDSARALAILEGNDKASKSAPHFVVQAGAFATQDKVNELQARLTAAGIKSFTQKVATSRGDKIRVRVGPFVEKEAAEKAKLQLEKLGINGTLIPPQ